MPSSPRLGSVAFVVPETMRFERWLAGIAALLAIVNILEAFIFSGSTSGSWHGALLRVGSERSIATWYSILLLAGAGAFAWGQAARVHLDRIWWRLLGAALLAASMEELIGLHEMLNGRLEQSVLPGNPFPWVVVGAIGAALLGLLFLGFILRRPPPVRWRLLIGGVVFVAGAVGMEFWAGVILSHPGAGWPVLHSTAEELMEMLGTVIVIGGILRAPVE